MFTRPLPKTFIILVVGIAVINAAANYFFWYWEFRPLDKIMHFASGFWLGGVGLWWYYFGRRNAGKTRLRDVYVMMGIAITFALGVGFLWELLEVGLDIQAGRIAQYDMRDTGGDLVADFLGGLISVAYMRSRGRYLLKENSN